MMDIKEVSLLWLMNTLRKKLSSSGIKPMPNSVLWTQLRENLQANFIDQSLKNYKEEKYINHLNTIFGVLIQLIC